MASFTAPRHIVESAWLEHGPFAFWLMEAARPRIFVELGTHHGYSFLAVCQAVEQLGLDTACTAVDTWEGDRHAGFYGDEVHARLAAETQAHYSGFARLLRCRFDAALAHIPDGSIDLLHIDGRHTYEDVREDFESWLPKLSSRAVVLFHDTQVRREDFGVWRYWAELSERYPGFEFRHGHGLGVLAVGPEMPPGLRGLFDAQGARADDIRTTYEGLGRAVGKQHRLDVKKRELEAALAEEAKRAQALELRLALLETSTLWRMTAPARRGFALLPRPVRVGLRRGATLLWWAATPHRLPRRIAALRVRADG